MLGSRPPEGSLYALLATSRGRSPRSSPPPHWNCCVHRGDTRRSVAGRHGSESLSRGDAAGEVRSRHRRTLWGGGLCFERSVFDDSIYSEVLRSLSILLRQAVTVSVR